MCRHERIIHNSSDIVGSEKWTVAEVKRREEGEGGEDEEVNHGCR